MVERYFAASGPAAQSATSAQVQVQRKGKDFQAEDQTYDTVYSDQKGAEVQVQNGAIIYIQNHGKTILDVPVSDNTSVSERDFKKPQDIQFDRQAFDAFLKSPEHQQLVAQLERDHVTTPTALGHTAIKAVVKGK